MKTTMPAGSPAIFTGTTWRVLLSALIVLIGSSALVVPAPAGSE